MSGLQAVTDLSGNAFQITPKGKVVYRKDYQSGLSSAQTIAIDPTCALIRFYATEQDVFLKWGSTEADSGNFDMILPVGQVVDLEPEIDTSGIVHTSLTVEERTSGAKLIVIQYAPY